MTIGIDTSRVVKPHLTGTEYYSLKLIQAMSKIDESDRFILYAPENPLPRLGELGDNFKTKIMPFPKFWSQIRLSLEMFRHKPDVLFVPSHLVPLIHPQNTVVTLHDLGFKHFPELYPPHEIFYHNWGMNFSAKHAQKIIAISEFTKHDLMKTYGISPDKITVIYEGCNFDLFKPNPNTKKKPYIFYIGRLEEKKNVAGMIRAYGILRQEEKIKHQFILAGKPGFNYEKIEEEIKKLPADVQKDIIQLGYIDEKTYVKYLQEADVFFFCTHFEGFGLPIIEAMACGTPVVTSNVTSMPEIAGNAAICVDPKKPFEMAAALSKVINNSNIKQSMILKGRVRSKIFTWEACAKKTLEVLKSE